MREITICDLKKRAGIREVVPHERIQAVEKTDACGPKGAHRDRGVSQVYDERVSSVPVLLTVSFLFSLSCGPVGGFAIRHDFKPALSPFS